MNLKIPLFGIIAATLSRFSEHLVGGDLQHDVPKNAHPGLNSWFLCSLSPELAKSSSSRCERLHSWSAIKVGGNTQERRFQAPKYRLLN